MAHPVESLELVANLLPEPMLLVRAGGVIESGNAAFANAFGHPMRGLAARRLAELTLPGPEPLADYLRRCASTRQLVLGAITVRHSGGAEIPCRCEGAVLIPATDSDPALMLLRFIPKDQSVSRFVALTQKIEQLSAEISRRLRAEQLLLQERELLAVTLTSIGDGVITTDAKGRVTFMNRSAESLTGWTLADARDRPMDEVFHVVDEETRAPVENPAAKVLTGGTTVGLANHAVLMARDGHECAVDDSAAPIVDADGQLHGVVLVFRDVTDLRRARREERAARRAAESANHAKDRFLATLSHELRTPLNAILGWSRMLIRGTVGGERRRHGLVVIERNAELQARLVEDLLDVSRITTGKLRLRSDVVNVDELIRAAVDSIRPAANAKGLRLSVMGNNRATVVGDAERLQQVTWNLLTNAVKFTPAGGAVEIAVVESGSTVRLSVRDTGEGFTAEFKNLMFDAFSQGDASFSRPHGGLGLGLTIVRRLFEAHGGTVDADSPGVGQGATFIVTLPTAPADDLRQPLGRLPATAPVTLAGLSILVVDDEADSCELMAIVLHGSGAAVVTAGSARAALDLLERGRFDVVLADIGMPHEDGFWLIREIKRLPSAAQDTIPVIVVTAFASASDRQAVLDSGFDAHVPKPVDADNLTAAVDRARNRTPR